MKQIKPLSGLLFVVLLLLKVSAFHTYSHNDADDVQDCTTCILSLDNQQENHTVNLTLDISFSVYQVYLEYNNTYVSTQIKSTSSYFLFSRPPPTLEVLV